MNNNNAAHKEEKDIQPVETIKKDKYILLDRTIRHNWTIHIPKDFREHFGFKLGDKIDLRYLPLEKED